MISIANQDVECFDLLSDLVIIIRESNKILYCNERALKFLRFSKLIEVKDLPLINYISFSEIDDIKVDYKFLKQRKILNRVNIKLNTPFIDNISTEVVAREVIYQGTEGILLILKIGDLQEQEQKFLRDNITSKVNIEDNLQHNQASYLKFLEFIPFGVAVYDGNNVSFGNNSLLNVLGAKSLNEINKKDIKTFFSKNSILEFEDMHKCIFHNNKELEFRDVALKRIDGTNVEVELGAVPIFIDNKMSVIIIIHDITERKKAERDKFKLKEALKYDRIKTEFISNVSHELKTPLNIILSVVQMLEFNRRSPEPNSDKEYVDKYLGLMKQNCYRLLKLINNLIDISRIDMGYLKMDFGNYDIVKVIEDITLSTVEYVESKNLSLIFDTDVEEKIIGVDRENMERVMLNLLSNAVKYSKKNGEIFVTLHDLGDSIRISVKDNGEGIPKNMQEKIFERFIQNQSPFTKAHEGSGIGLSLVKSIVEAHDGKVYVKSKENKGSEFIVELPSVLSKKEPNNVVRKNDSTNHIQKIQIEFSDIYK